jgi:bacterial leucyl aminopeptidase
MPSVIGRIEGTNSSAPVVIIGAHLDSINADDPMSGRAPGADDDGSGAVNLIESFRKLTAAGFKPANPVEFHWYAGEEAGLLGSRAISNAYVKKGTRVRGMLQLGKSSQLLQFDPFRLSFFFFSDQTAYVRPGTVPVVGFITDYVNAALTTFTKTLVPTYCQYDSNLEIQTLLILYPLVTGVGIAESKCGYACSDHASWTVHLFH